jgi:hypothetical protein
MVECDDLNERENEGVILGRGVYIFTVPVCRDMHTILASGVWILY